MTEKYNINQASVAPELEALKRRVDALESLMIELRDFISLAAHQQGDTQVQAKAFVARINRITGGEK